MSPAPAKTDRRPAVTSKSGWATLGVHRVTLPSGAVVDIRIPDLTLLLAADAVPETLRTVAFAEIQSAFAAATAGHEGEVPQQVMDEERLQSMADLNAFMVSVALVNPKMTVEEIRAGAVPAEDVLMLTQFASRERNVDARGVQLGVERLDRWGLWRDAHECAENCEHCVEVIEALSSLALAE